MAILVVFGWPAGWNLLYQPKSENEIEKFRKNPKYEKTWELIHKMLHVSFNVFMIQHNCLFKTESKKRPGIKSVLKDLDEITKSVTGSNLSSDWQTGLPKCQPVKVEQNTQASVNVVQEIAKAMEGINLTQMATGGTNFHSQKQTYFCHSFGIVSGLRNALVHVAGNNKSKEVKYHSNTEVRANKTAAEVLTDVSILTERQVCEYKKNVGGIYKQRQSAKL